MALSLTNAQDILLSKFSYLDFAEDMRDFNANYDGKTLGQVAEYLLRDDIPRLGELDLDGRLPGGLGEAQFRDALSAIAADSTLSNMTLTNYVNNNGDGNSGYVGYALSSPDNNACLILSRGSESYPTNGSSLQDWIYTNVLGIGITGQAQQFNDAVAFAQSSSQGYSETLAVGHSLGAGLSLYIAASVDGFVAHGYDGPGISQMLSIDQLVRLINSGSINYVANSDFVGPIRYIPGITQFVQTNPNAFKSGNEVVNDKWWSGHCLDAFNIVNGNAVPASDRTVVSYISEILLGGLAQGFNEDFLLAKRALELIEKVHETTSNIVKSGIEEAGILVNKVLDTSSSIVRAAIENGEAAIGKGLDAIYTAVDAVNNIVQAGIDDAGQLANKTLDAASSIIDSAKEYGEAAINKGLETINDISDSVSKIVQSGIQGANNIINRVLDTTSDILDLISGKSNDVFNSGMNMLSRLSSEISSICQDMNFDNIRNSISSFFTSAQQFVYRSDPFTFDLDGDGIETTTVAVTTPVMFDYDGDGTKTTTGWIKSDDGFLVLDRNGNGTIDNASELFSDYTPLNSGGKTANGFAALQQEDTNNDGVLNNLDANWNNLRVWQDANSDGISQANELHTIDELGISGINTVKTNTTQTLADGNTIKGTGTYTRTDGTTGQTADVNLKVDTAKQQFPHSIPVSPEVEALPDMTGSGLVRTLREAASMSPALKTILTQYSQATTRNEQLAIIDELLYAWADTSGMAKTMDERDPEHYRIQYYAFGTETRYNNYVNTGNTGSGSGDSSGGSVGPYVTDTENTMLTQEYRDLITQWNSKLHILEAFNGRYFFAFPEQASAEGDTARMGMGVYTYVLGGVGSSPIRTISISFAQQQLSFLNQSYEALRQSVYEALFYQTRLQTVFVPLLDKVNLVVGENNTITWDYSQLEQHFADSIAANAATGMSDFLEFNLYVANNYLPIDWRGNEIFADYCRTLPVMSELQNMYDNFGNYLHILGEDKKYYYSSSAIGEEIIAAENTNTTIIGGSGYDIIIGGTGNDNLYGGAGDDYLSGGSGDNTLSGDVGNDMLKAGEGSDRLYGGTGNDTLQGGAGNDFLYGGADFWTDYQVSNGNDTYLFGRGSGQDAIVDYDDKADNVDTILIDSDISPVDVTLRRNWNDLELSINGTADKLTINYWFGDESGAHQVEHIQFSDGTLWDVPTIKLMMLQGTNGDDVLLGYNSAADRIQGLGGDDLLVGNAGDDTLEGDTGNDYIYGGADNDFINGGEGKDSLFGGAGDDVINDDDGNDTIFGGDGNDTIDGGAGDDSLYGGSYNAYYTTYWNSNVYVNPDRSVSASNGNDIYLFGRGAGRDIIYDYDKTAGNMDTILVNDDISPSDVTLHRANDDLVLSINGVTEKLTVDRWFEDDAGARQVEQIQFADGTLWDVPAIKQMALQATPGDDVIIGFSTPDSIDGLAGDDQIYGREGDDILEGNSGYDALYGETGNDILRGGEGNDILNGGAGEDALEGGAGNDYLYGGSWGDDSQYVSVPNGNDTYLLGRGSGQDTIYDFDPTADNIDTILLESDISPAEVTLKRSGDNLVLSINDTSDIVTVNDWFKNETEDYQVENIRFADGSVWDVAAIKQMVLQGTPGDDYLVGYSSADVFDGGAGNDTLSGNKGNDTYIFGRGYGYDTITDLDSTSDNTDAVILDTDVLPADVTLRRGGDDLFIIINGTSDRLQIKNWFSSDDNKVEYIRFTDGTIWDSSVMQNAIEHPTDTNDYLVGTTQADVIDGGGGNDEIFGLEGNDTLYGGTGDDFIDAYEGDNVIYGNEGNDNLFAGWGNDIIYGGAGGDYIEAGDGNNFLYGGDGIDILYGGMDLDVMDGGAGDDYLDGSNGKNNYIVNRGSGFDLIHTSTGGSIVPRFAAAAIAVTPTPTPAEETDTVFFGAGITPEMLRIQVNDGSIDGGGLRIAVGAGMDEGILISGQGGSLKPSLASVSLMAESTGEAPQLTDLPVKRFAFADGRELTLEEIIARADNGIIGYQNGTDGGDWLLGSVANDEIYGNGGDDRMDGRDNEDYLAGGDGNDVISAGSGQDEISGDAGNDITAGGKGDEQLYGESGSDVYCFNRGDGHDYIYDNSQGTSSDIDTISFGTTINPEDIAAYISNDGNLVLTIKGTEDSISIYWFNPNGYAAYPDAGIDRVQFVDGNGYARIFDLTGVVSSLNDSLIASDSNNPVSLFTTSGFELTGSATQAGGNYAVAYAQTDDLFAVPTYYNGDSGDDIINGRAGDDIIAAGDGNNIINAGDGDNTITAGSGDDQIISGSGNDILNGGGGGDALTGGSGDDTYYYNAGYGAITIDDLADASGGNKIIFGEGIIPDSLSLTAADGFLMINTGGSGDTIKLTKFTPEDAYGSHAIETYEFADGQITTYQQLIDKGFECNGTAGEDILTGTTATDRIDALGGSDILAGGKGNDILNGGSGDDVYIFNPGDGVDTIIDGAAANAVNSVQFGEGISLSDLTLTAHQNTLIIQVGQNGDALHLEGFNPDNIADDPAVSVFRFADGSMISHDRLISRGFTFTGTSGNDELRGTNTDDTFTGGQGDDNITGGTGNDTYIFNPGDRADTITDEAAFLQPNILVFGNGIKPEDISLSHDPANKHLIINSGNNNDSIRLSGFDSSTPYGSHAIEYFQFSNGPVLSYSQLIDRGFDIIGTGGTDNLSGTVTTDRISGMAENDTLQGGMGNDTLSGGSGDDTYVFNLGDGVDVIDDIATATEGNTLVFGEDITLADMQNHLTYSDDTLIIRIGENGDEVQMKGFDPTAADTGQHAIEIFKFTDGTVINYEELVQNTFIVQGDYSNDNLRGTNMADRLYGYEGSDKLEGANGNDVLTGGTGNEELLGGSGSDTYVFNIGDGVDTITDASIVNEGNLILFGEGITKDDLTFVRSNGILTINVGTNDDTINLLNFDQNEINGTLVVRTLQFADGLQINLTDLLNRPPVASNPIAAQTAMEDAAFSFTLPENSFTDPDVGDILTYSAVLADGTALPAWLTFNSATRTLSGRPTNDNVGILSLKVTATDTSGAFISSDFNITVQPIVNYGTNHTDFIITGNKRDFINALGGSDIVYTGEGNDTIYGGAGTDFLCGDGGNDAIYGENDSDILWGGNGNDTLDGGTGRDVMLGGAGNDTITGGNGNDTLTGGTGSDTYLFGGTDGKDTLTETAGVTGDMDTLKLTDGITTTEPVLVKQKNDLYVFIDENNYTKIISEFQQANYGIERLEVTDGHYITRQDIQTIVDTMSIINNNSGMDVLQKYNAMLTDQQYQNILTASWQQ